MFARGRIGRDIRDFVDSLGIRYNVAETPKMIVEAQLLDDIFISNRLAALNELGAMYSQVVPARRYWERRRGPPTATKDTLHRRPAGP